MYPSANALRTRCRAVAATVAWGLGSISLLTGIYGNSVTAKAVSAVSGLMSLATGAALYPQGASISDAHGSVELGLAVLQNRVTNPLPDEVAIGSTTSSIVKETTLPAPVAAHAAGLREALTRPQLRRPASYTATKALTEAHPVRSGLQDQSTSHEHTLNTALGATKADASITPDCKHDEDTGGSLTCLLVEDNPISLKILERLLIRMGCVCALAHDGAEAISAAFGEIKFDFILTDLSMPKVDGKTFARCIKSVTNKNQSTPIIAVSAYEMAAIPDGLFDASISKPIRRLDLIPLLLAMGHQISIQDPSESKRKISP